MIFVAVYHLILSYICCKNRICWWLPFLQSQVFMNVNSWIPSMPHWITQRANLNPSSLFQASRRPFHDSTSCHACCERVAVVKYSCYKSNSVFLRKKHMVVITCLSPIILKENMSLAIHVVFMCQSKNDQSGIEWAETISVMFLSFLPCWERLVKPIVHLADNLLWSA